MAHSSKDHGDPMLVGSCDNFFVTNRSTGLNNGSNTSGSSSVNSVSEREEGIGCHHRACYLKVLISSFDTSDLGAVYTAHLAGANANRHTVFGIHNRIRFHKFGYFPAE